MNKKLGLLILPAAFLTCGALVARSVMVTKVNNRHLSIKAKELFIVSVAMAAPFILFFM